MRNSPDAAAETVGFDVDFADGKFRVPVDRWEALRKPAEGLVGARHGRVQARRLACLTGTVISMHMSWCIEIMLRRELY